MVFMFLALLVIIIPQTSVQLRELFLALLVQFICSLSQLAHSRIASHNKTNYGRRRETPYGPGGNQ